ncbi:exosome complex component RRP4-like protein [Glomus cerebriforme]|uniref:Exosome complex component RRP4-like protein n=1 Tax=Glomus cerebriforme TaxID=658196 RepID=A0A397TIJ1_9GLOM|nr:exosome complex component RRP4-like protein [Glomus cerebriforme]
MTFQFLSPKSSSYTNKVDVDGDIDMLLKTERENFETQVVTPGEIITSDTQYMRGHGTFTTEKNQRLSSVAGVVEHVNKLISVRSLHARYTGDIGDLVIGRITEVSQRRWKVDINSRQDAVLLLSAINLPGGIQRRKTEADELQMRKFFSEGDLLVAEVQGTFQDGSSSLHTRNSKYGKLRNGSFVIVPQALVQRCKTHFHTLPCGVDLTLGLNGYIWVSKHTTQTAEELEIYSNENEEIDQENRESIARVCNSISVLSRHFMCINDKMIMLAYEASLNFLVKDLLKLDVMEVIISEVSEKMTLLKAGVRR